MSALSLAVTFLPLALFSILAFWRNHGLLYILTAAVSLFVGFSWYDTYTTDMGLTISICLFGYALVCIGMAIRSMIQRKEA